MFKWGVFASITTVASFVAGLPWGAIGVATAYVIGVIARLPVHIWYVTRDGPVRARDFYGALALPTVLALALAVSLLLTRGSLSEADLMTRTVSGLVVTLAVTLVIMAMSPASRRNVGTFARALKRR